MFKRLLAFFTVAERDESLWPTARSASPDEATLLAQLKAAGLDWRRSVESLRAEDTFDIANRIPNAIYIPSTTALTRFPIQFYVRPGFGQLDCSPPNEYTADIDLHGDAIRNFCAVGDSLIELFGNGRRESTSNAISLVWEIGDIRAMLIAWPPHMDASNKHPRVLLRIASRIPRTPTDESLRDVLGLNSDCYLNLTCRLPTGWVWELARENFAAPRNPVDAFRDVDSSRPLIWRNPSTDRFGISGREVSLVFSKGKVLGVAADDDFPERGGHGQRGIALMLSPPHAGADRIRLGSVWTSIEEWHAMDLTPLIEELAGFWSISKISRS